MQAIQCKYLSPTNVRGARIKASAWAGSITVPYPHEKNQGEDAHRVAADALMAKLGWDKDGFTLVGGCLPDQRTWVFCLVRADADLRTAATDVLPDLERYAAKSGPGPDARLARLKAVLS